jgi:hypothetical protein
VNDAHSHSPFSFDISNEKGQQPGWAIEFRKIWCVFAIPLESFYQKFLKTDRKPREARRQFLSSFQKRFGFRQTSAPAQHLFSKSVNESTPPPALNESSRRWGLNTDSAKRKSFFWEFDFSFCLD